MVLCGIGGSLILLLLHERHKMHLQDTVIVGHLTKHVPQPLVFRIHTLELHL